jgi:glycosyltransferase involved in cell wall biosynthesis
MNLESGLPPKVQPREVFVYQSPMKCVAKKRVAYLLADAGIRLSESRKGCSIHARSMIKAFEDEGAKVDIYTMLMGNRKITEHKVMEVKRSKLTRWWRDRLIGRELWRKLPGCRGRAKMPNWIDGVLWILWHHNFFRYTLKRTLIRKPDLIYARHSWFAFPYYWLKRRLGVPLYLEVNAVFSIEKEVRGEAAFSYIARKIEKRIFECADQILPVSTKLKDQIVRFGIDPGRVRVTPNAVDTEHFRRSKCMPYKLDDSFVICSVNSFRDYHGNETLLKAACLLREKIPMIKILMIGGGARFDYIRCRAKELNIDANTEFTGVIDHSLVPSYIDQADICVAPYEGNENEYNCPMKLFEYMAMKTPIVASDWGDIPHIVTHGQTAILHKPGDPQSLADALEMVWRDPEGSLRRVEAAFQFVKTHTWRAIARNILGFDSRLHQIRQRLLEQAESEAERITQLRQENHPEHYPDQHPDYPFRMLDPQEGIYTLRQIPDTNLPDDGLNEIPPHYFEDPDYPYTFVDPDQYELRKSVERQDEGKLDSRQSTQGIPEMISSEDALFDRRLRKLYDKHGCNIDLNTRELQDGLKQSIRILRMASVISQGGVAKVCLQSMLRVPAERVEQYLLVFGELAEHPEPLRSNRPDIHYINELMNLWPSSYLKSIFKDIELFTEIIRKVKPHIIHVHEPQYTPAVRIAVGKAGGCHVAVHLHNDYNIRKGSIKNSQLELHQLALRQSHLIACCQTIYDASIRWLRQTCYPTVKIYDGADDIIDDRHDTLFLNNLKMVAKDRKIITMMAHIAPHKRIEDFLLACRILIDEGHPIFMLLMCYGKEKNARRLRRRVNKMFKPLEGEFLFRVKSPIHVLEQVHLGVSSSGLEGLGLNILEYQILGIPVVCTDLIPHREMVTDDVTGLLYPTGDIAKLLCQIRRYLDNEGVYHRIGKAGQESACKRSWKRTGECTVDFYEDVLRREPILDLKYK